jgi:hypothetical protein
MLGHSAKELLIEDLEKHGIVFDNRHSYTLKEINAKFVQTFGKDTAPLLTYRLSKILNDLKLLAIASLPTVQFSAICITSSCVCFVCNCLGMMQTTMHTPM